MPIPDASSDVHSSEASGSVKRTDRRPSRFFRWSISGCFVGFLLIAGYFGGRSAGFDSGRQEGIELGYHEGYERSLRMLGFAQGHEHLFDVADLLDARIGGLPPGDAAQRRVDAELRALVDEIYAGVEPGTWNDPDRGNYRIEASGTNLTLNVRAKPRVIGAVGRYLLDQRIAHTPPGESETAAQ